MGINHKYIGLRSCNVSASSLHIYYMLVENKTPNHVIDFAVFLLQSIAYMKQICSKAEEVMCVL